MTPQSLLRHGARVVLPLGIAAAAVTMAAAPALAAASLSISGSHLSNGKVDANDQLTISGSGTATDPTGLSSARTVKLSVRTPGSGTYVFDSKTVKSNRDSAASATFDTSCAPWSGCAPAANGSYTFVYDDGSRTATKDVTLVIPPAAPNGFTAKTSGTVATFDWQPNGEPDLIGYAIRDGGADVTQGGIDADSVCDASGCQVTVDFGADARGTEHTFSVVALRHTSPGSSGSVQSAPSASQTVSFAAPPSPSGSPGGGTGSGSGSGSGGSSAGGGNGGGAGGGGHGGSAPSGKHPAADLRASLPSFTAGAAPHLPTLLTEVKPLPQGTYKPVLPYGDQTTRDRVKAPTVGTTAGVVHDIARVLDVSPLWRGLAGAAVLFLVAAHLHSWVRRVDTDEPPMRGLTG